MSSKNTPTNARLNRIIQGNTPKSNSTPNSRVARPLFSKKLTDSLSSDHKSGTSTPFLPTSATKTPSSAHKYKPKTCTTLNACYTPSSLFKSAKSTPRSAFVTSRSASKHHSTPECSSKPMNSSRRSEKSLMEDSVVISRSMKDVEMSNLTVAVRVRPLNAQECTNPGVTNIVKVTGNEVTVYTGTTADNSAGVSHSFQYDQAFYSCNSDSGDYADQETVFKGTGMSLIDRAFEGYNACLFAYGQTGSGKSYSMMGIEVDDSDDINPEAGIIPRFCHELFRRIEESKDTIRSEIEVSYFEIYNEKIHDLLCVSGHSESNGCSATHKNALKVREHPIWGPYVVDLSIQPVESYSALRNWLAVGNSQRATAATGMNDKSSRSHSIFNIVLNLSEIDTSEKDGEEEKIKQTRRSKISLVDLAGSERITHTGSNGDRVREGVSINKSLLTLGKVISKLAESKKQSNFVPYRESVLTWLLRQCKKIYSISCNLSGPLSDVQTAVNLDVSLPCNLTPGTTIPDKVQLVIWYKKGHIKPIYTFDARGRQLHQATRWADEFVLKNKADFFYDSNPPILRIQNVQTSDAGLYKCRVDFHKSPTRNFRINVTVLVPPTNLTILDTYGESIKHNVAGPYIEGNNINLTCLSSGGIPPPKVTWWKEHALVDKSFQVFPDGTVKNILHLYNISRKDLFSVYTCHANNGHMAPVLSKKVTVEIILPPLNILLQGLNHPLVAGVSTQITCTSVGARPPPKIEWKKGGIPMLDATQTTSADGNLTISELVFIPAPEDNKKEIECVVANTLDHKQDLMIETNFDDNPYKKFEFFFKDFRFLNVTHAPIVSLNLGAPLDADNLLIGSDVYLECTIVANPAITRIEWYHNDRKLHSSRGILISNQTLVLQGISKTTHGKYFCLAINIQGSVSSNEIFLDVKYPPMCKTESTIIRAAIKQIINITCLVDSNPTNNLDYKWRFNSSLDSSIELPYNSRQMHGFDNLSPMTLPLKGKISSLEHEHTYCNHCHQNQKHSHHHRGFLKKNQRSLIDLIDFRTKAHLPPSVLSTSLISQLYTTTPNKGHNISGHWSYTNVLSENGTQLLNEFIKVDNSEPSYKGNPQDENQDAPFAEMLYSNMVYTNQLPETQRVYNKNIKLLKKENIDAKVNNEAGISVYDQSNKGNHLLPINSVYQYNIESYESFGAVSCVASNQIGQSQPCWYHIQPADLPDAVKSCIAYNVTPSSIEVHCIPGYDGGIQQHFHVQVYDELNRQVLYNKTFRHSNFKINRLPSDSVFLLRITSINLQGSSKLVYRFRARTLSMPLLQTASSTAVLVQLTPLLGALLGLVTTLVLMVICIAIFIKLRTKNIYHSNINSMKGGNKGSVELFNRNMGSRSSLEDKNPDVVPLENSEDEFCADRETINRLNMSYRVLSTQPTRHENMSSSSSSQMQPLTLKQNTDSVFLPSSSNNICNSPERVNKTFNTPSTSLLSNKATSNIYTRIPEKTYYPNFEPQTTSSSPYGSLTISTMPLLEQRKTSHIQSLQSQIHQLDDSQTTPPRQHCTPPETAMFCNFNMFS